MRENFIQDIYLEHLVTINGVNFTRREIDIIACLLNARGTSKIASLLSIAPRTVVTHIRNIMLKLECNSRENIIDFMEQSDKLSVIKKHYSNLLIDEVFIRSLKGIAKAKHGPEEKPVCTIIGWQELHSKNLLIQQLVKHLQYAGIKAFIGRKDKLILNENNTESQRLNYIIYILSAEFLRQFQDDSSVENLELSQFTQDATQCLSPVILLSLDSDFPLAISSAVKDAKHISFLKQKNYHSLVLEILKIILLNNNLDKTISEFEERYKVACSAFEHLSVAQNSEIKGEQKQNKGYLPNTDNLNNKKKDPHIWSDLIIPTESTLLKRADLITQIEETFKAQESIQTTALVGIGGVGKTTLARRYARQQNVKVAWEINAASHKSLISSFESLASALCITEEEKRLFRGLREIKNSKEREENFFLLIKQKLKSVSNWVLIYDGVRNFGWIQKYLPHNSKNWGKGKVLITTRDSTIQNNMYINRVLHIGELDPEEKLSLFIKIMSEGGENQFTLSQEEEAKKFLCVIPPFPLDISIAAYYLKATHASYARYSEHLKQYNGEFENIQVNILRETNEYAQTRYSIITLSLQQLIDSHRDFEELLLFVSLVDFHNIPRDILDVYKENTVVDNFIYNLKKYSLIVDQPSLSLQSVSTFSIHRSTQEISLAYLTEKIGLEKARQLLLSIANTLESYMACAINNFVDSDCFSRMKFLVYHFEKFLSHTNLLTDIIRRPIDEQLGCIYFYLSYYTKAKQSFERSLSELNKKCDKDHIKIARHLTYLGDIYRKLGYYKKAKDLLKQSLIIYKQHYSDYPIYVAWILALLGDIHRRLGNYEKAKNFLEESLIIYKKHFPPQHLYISWVLTHLGNVYRELEDYETAKKLLEEGLVAYEKDYGEGHIETAFILRDLGQTYLLINHLELAENLLIKALEIFRQNKHSESYIALESLGDLHLKQSARKIEGSDIKQSQDFKTAGVDYLQQALEIVRAYFPKHSPHIKRIQIKINKIVSSNV